MQDEGCPIISSHYKPKFKRYEIYIDAAEFRVALDHGRPKTATDCLIRMKKKNELLEKVIASISSKFKDEAEDRLYLQVNLFNKSLRIYQAAKKAREDQLKVAQDLLLQQTPNSS